MKKITKIKYNQFQTAWDGSAGEDWSQYEVGKEGVTSIIEHPAGGEGDKWFYDVNFEDGRMERLFNPNTVYFEKYTP